MIGVSGATGNLGRSTLQALSLRAPKDRIVAIVRDPARASDLAEMGFVVRRGDYNDADSMRAALFGVEKFLLISSNELTERVAQHERAIGAAAQAGVSLLAYTSILHCDVATNALAEQHRATEATLRASEVPYVILRNGWYLENYSEHLGPILASGTLMGAAAQGRISAASRADYAQAAAVVLTEPGHMNRIYELAGDEHFSLNTLAAAISKHSGKPIAFKSLAQQDYVAALIAHQVPNQLAHMLANSDAGIARGELQDDSHRLSALLGRPTRSLDSLLEEVLGHGAHALPGPHEAR